MAYEIIGNVHKIGTTENIQARNWSKCSNRNKEAISNRSRNNAATAARQ